ncbi:MAG: alpha amylase C-terminal domain-containing protein [Bacteroidales bacterium]
MQAKLIQQDPWLEPYKVQIEHLQNYIQEKEQILTQNGQLSLSDFASGYLYYGLHKEADRWVFREWAPNATQIFLTGTFNNWECRSEFELKPIGNGNWEVSLPLNAIRHEDYYKIKVIWNNGWGDRIPAYATRVVQDKQTYLFSAQVWDPVFPYKLPKKKFRPKSHTLKIYECHVGMAQEEGKVGSYLEFRDLILPRIAAEGYNAIQVMAIQEHPYYGSFGYHVSSFFACSSRFGTPDELKALIDAAHQLDIAVIMDIVHSHSVKNENEGLARQDGSDHQYFHADEKREHPQWDSLCFDYGRNEVIHFLMSNCKYWIEEYQFDGFRFDGVTSMLYYNHGLGADFMTYADYFNKNVDKDAVTYLTLTNKMIHEVNRNAITIAEDMSGMPGMALPCSEGGIGFDYRLSMGIPDFWIKTIKELKDEQWKPSTLFWELTNRRSNEKTISYVESHDQALVGDKTVIFRLIDADMYWGMSKLDAPKETVDRGLALHKMIRLITASTINGGYLNFMGNEFGHPEWIDFPREGNNWSSHHARRQWSLMDDKNLKFHFLSDFDKAMLEVISAKGFIRTEIKRLCDNDNDQVLAFQRKDLIFVFNFSPVNSYSDYGILAPRGSYSVVLNTDDSLYGGFNRIDKNQVCFTHLDPLYRRNQKEWIKLYIPARTAIVLKKNKD